MERFHIIRPIPPLTFNLRSSAHMLGRKKMRFCDPALTCSLLNADTPQKLLSDIRTFGLVFESLCVRDLLVYSQAIGAEVCYYRDSSGNEIDAAVVACDGTWAAFEIKLGLDSVDAAARRLRSVAAGIPEGVKKPAALAVIVPSAPAAYRRPDGVCVVPIGALRD